MNKVQVIKVNSGEIISICDGKKFFCDIRGNLKRQGKICVGDFVEVDKNPSALDRLIIAKIYPRKNQLVRPVIVNVDQMLIVISILPKPDLLLVDKLLIYCVLNKIEPIIILNKLDIDKNGEFDYLMAQYEDYYRIIQTSTKTGQGIDELKDALKEKLSVFVGQSAVGKSTLINTLVPSLKQNIGDLSKKIERGKNTTRITEIFENDEIRIADTPGFSMLELKDVDYKNLKEYFPEISKHSGECKFLDCDHVNTKPNVCAVSNLVSLGFINKDRYERYCKLYLELHEKWRNQYD